jgi:hypothetical protein
MITKHVIKKDDIIHTLNYRIQEGNQSNYIQFNNVPTAPYTSIEEQEKSKNLLHTMSQLFKPYTLSEV